jgi:hypothetical protein
MGSAEEIGLVLLDLRRLCYGLTLLVHVSRTVDLGRKMGSRSELEEPYEGRRREGT